jgi:hypothetical protein
MSRVTTFILIAALAGCDSGNYSNEDIDFQLALPARDDIAVRMPTQALETNDSAEFYRNTRATVRNLDGSADAFLSLLDHVRATAPSERLPDRRVWGPFPILESPLWVVRLAIERIEEAGKPLRFAYSLEFRAAADTTGPWNALFRGQFTPGSSARRGDGVLEFTSAAARAAGYPLGDLAKLERFLIAYKTDAFPLRVTVDVTNYQATDSATFQHTEEQDGAGFMHFTFPTGDVRASLLDFKSRWLGSGAGRADVTVLAGTLFVGVTATECWGIDTRPVFIRRPWEPLRNKGMESDCVFPAPAP